MTIKVGRLEADIGADTSDLRRADKEIRRTAGQMGRSFQRLGNVIQAALAFQAVKSTVMLADRMERLDQKIKNVSRSAREFKTIRQGIRDIAKETGGSIDSIATLSQALLIASESVGATSDQVVTMTNNLSKLGTIGGSSAEQMSNAMLQFGQGMAGGVLRAEEFNSIVENTPVIAQAIARGMGKNVGELRKMVIEGKVLSSEVFAALEGQTDAINKKFAAMPLTVDRASGMIANAFSVAVQEIDKGFSVTESIAESMSGIASIIADDLVPAVDEVYLQFKEIAILWDEVTQDAQDATDETFNWSASLKLVKDAISFIWTALKELPANLRDITTIVVGTFAQAWVKVKAEYLIFTEVIKFSLVNAVTGALVTVRQKFNEFIGGAQILLSTIFNAVGADQLAAALRDSGTEAIQFGADLNSAFEEQKQERMDQMNEELIAIVEMRDIKLEASQSAIDSGIAETDALKTQVQKRIAEMRKEIAARRTVTKDAEKQGEELVKDEETNFAKQQANLRDANSTVNSLRDAGLVDARTAAAAQIGISAATAISKTSELGFPQALPFIAQALSTIATARRQLKGSGRVNGGPATGGVATPVNEGGAPEMFVDNSGRQFILPDQSGKVVPLDRNITAINNSISSARTMINNASQQSRLNVTGAMSAAPSTGNMGGLSVVVNNNSDAVVSDPVITEGRLMFEINNAVNQAVDQVNTSLASQRGETAEALRQGFAQNRNI